MIQFKGNARTDSRKDGRKDGRTDRSYFIGPFRLPPDVQKCVDHIGKLTTKILKEKFGIWTEPFNYQLSRWFWKELNRYALLKNWILRQNRNLFMTKELKKVIMLQSKLKRIFNKGKTHFQLAKIETSAKFLSESLKKDKENNILPN